MNTTNSHAAHTFDEQGFVKIPNFLQNQEVATLTKVVETFHHAWIKDNKSFYEERAINSAYLTTPQYLDEAYRLILFELLGKQQIIEVVQTILTTPPAFMGTQLFFNPVNINQPNYWHRDGQYHLNEDEQKAALAGPQVLHVRIALKDELGIEVIPKSHKNWDTEQELNIRLEKNAHKNHEDLPSGQSIPLKAGDIVIFSANMIHRGLYGMDRLALDLLYCDRAPELLEFVQKDGLPSDEQLSKLDNHFIFRN